MNDYTRFCDLSEENCGGNKGSDKAHIKYNPDKYKSKLEFYNTFPNYTFIFGEYEQQPYTIGGAEYLYEEKKDSNEYRVGIDRMGDRTILGGIFMRNHDVVFDKEKSVVGWA